MKAILKTSSGGQRVPLRQIRRITALSQSNLLVVLATGITKQCISVEYEY
jgi:hypothetical protein